jgi:serine/threonine protein kinase
MEYLEGEDLGNVFVRRGTLPADEVVGYMFQGLRGLAHAHEKGVIHRDVKPSNLFLVRTGTVKLLDLGFGELVGKSMQGNNVFDTDEGVVVGTTDFMSPEQVKDKPIDARTDLFSLGCTMYNLLTGAYAFPGGTREDRLVKRIHEPHVPITELRPDLPHNLVEIVDRLLAIHPEDRFASAAQAAEALDTLIAPAGRSERGQAVKPAANTAGAGTVSRPAEPEAPVDWSMIESALRPTDPSERRAPRPLERNEPKPPPTKGLAAHRSALEGEGTESGREVHKKYRNELIQMNRAMAELRSAEEQEGAPSAVATWLDRIGEKLGDFLAEPSASPILILVILGIVAVATIALAYVAG